MTTYNKLRALCTSETLCEFVLVRENKMKDIVILRLLGPYKLFGNDGNSLFNTDISRKNGIYFWTVKYKNGYLIDYIGETGKTFCQRMKEHLIETLGGNYRICDPDKLLQGKEKIVWNGLWRKGTRDKIGEFIRKKIGKKNRDRHLFRCLSRVSRKASEKKGLAVFQLPSYQGLCYLSAWKCFRDVISYFVAVVYS
ncbi:hypothetical protein Kole_0059 [Kosmotoga olearia TBF 19.5.1]|uniref:GIY-YIG domain-containing protein n=2 Tax=Kosmotoga TaxID=651456 RepID=C5CHT2_KOSOT|nr:hypothetical protein Kole_0059 [Kosmotoga olearia TBF 19.5.1]